VKKAGWKNCQKTAEGMESPLGEGIYLKRKLSVKTVPGAVGRLPSEEGTSLEGAP